MAPLGQAATIFFNLAVGQLCFLTYVNSYRGGACAKKKKKRKETRTVLSFVLQLRNSWGGETWRNPVNICSHTLRV